MPMGQIQQVESRLNSGASAPASDYATTPGSQLHGGTADITGPAPEAAPF